MLNWFRQFAKGLEELVFPQISRCLFCENPFGQGEICGTCQKELAAYSSWPRCQHCGRFFPEDAAYKICEECRNNPGSLELIRSVLPYQDLARQIVGNLKYRQERRLVEPMAVYLAQAIQSEKRHFQVIIPVPMFSGKLKKRGFNQAALLAEAVAAKLDLPWKEGLKKLRDTHSQAGLNKQERLSNLQGTLAVTDSKAIEGQNILLIDDVLTTGSTLEACSNILRQNGAVRVWGLVFASSLPEE